MQALPLREMTRRGRGRLKPQLGAQFHQAFFSDSPALACAQARATLLHASPNVWLLDNFVSPDQLLRLIGLLPDSDEFEPSYTMDGEGVKVFDENRTSKFFHFEHPPSIVTLLKRKAADALGVPMDHVQEPQFVWYDPKAFFNLHHDAGLLVEDTGEIVLPTDQPLRTATLFVYLNDLDPGIGCTAFPALDLRVTPKKGTAVLFPNITREGNAERSTVHAAEPLPEGCCKLGMNLWVTDRSLTW